ncbi:MAG: phosphopyruvate hydratase, partial [Patescibacteria group bacterium]
MLDSRIFSVAAREILDSRDNPTVETTVILNSGYRGTASVPAGASLGKYEAVELRDNDPQRYGGMGVLKAVGNVNNVIGPKLRDVDALNQGLIDKTMVDLDGTPDKHNLGANSILSVSLATAVAAAAHLRQPLYAYLNKLFNAALPTPLARMPTPTFNVINGGKHGAGNLDFQEFHIIPATNKPYHEALEMGVEIYDATREILIHRNAVHSVGDEGGFAPNLFTNLDAMEVLSEAIRTTRYRFGVDVFFGLDLAASNFKKERGYLIKDRPGALSRRDLIDYLKQLHKEYRLLILEDPLEEDDWEGWKLITQELGSEVLIVGDDLLTTNRERLQRAIAEKTCSAILLKPNQIGTLSEFFAVTVLAKQNDIKCIVSHRSGETNDTFIADLAVAVQTEYVKFGAPAGGERVAKYN